MSVTLNWRLLTPIYSRNNMVVITGVTGMLGQALKKEAEGRGVDVKGIARKDAGINIDITDESLLAEVFSKYKPGVFINTAAITSIEACENDPCLAYLTNTRPLAFMADLCRKYGTYLIQISTDHFYAGDGAKKHSESDPVTLVNEYARGKYLAEQAALTNIDACVIRTNIVGFRNRGKPSFAEWIVSSLKNGDEINAFDDAYVSSIDVYFLSKVIFDLINLKPAGIYNIASCEAVSKKDFIMKFAEKMALEAKIKPCSVHSLSGVRRGDGLALDVSKIEELLYKMPGMEDVINRLVKHAI